MAHRTLLPVLAGTVLIVGIGWNLNASAGQKTTPDKPKASAQKPPKLADLTLKDAHVDEKTNMVTGRDFVYKQDDMTITGSQARYNKKTRRLLAEGDLTMDDPQYHTTGDKADVDDSAGKKLAIITGNVKIVIKPKDGGAPADPNQKEDVGATRKRGGTVTCDRLESYYKKKFSTLSGNLVFKQTITKEGREVERTITADHADYDSKAEKMLLYPPVKGRDTDGQTFEFSDVVTVGTKEGAETISSPGLGKFTIRIEEEEEDDGTTPPPPANDGKK